MREFISFYKKAGGGEGARCNYPDRLDTYGCGCQHDCAYCYAKSLLDFRGLWNADEPAVADSARVASVIRKIEPGSVVRLGGMTDCLMPLEESEGATYRAIRELNERGVHYLIVTKSPLIASDKYVRAMDRRLAHIQVSITSTQPNDYERAASPDMRIRAAEKLSGAGFDTALRVSPYIPQNIELEALRGIEVRKCLVEFLRVNHWVRQWLDIDLSEYTHHEGGYYHLPLKRKLELLRPFKEIFEQVSVCEDCDSHYQRFKYFYNANKDDCCNLDWRRD